MTTPLPDSTPVAILLVEDETLIRMLAADVLIEAGFRVIEAGDAHEAMVLLEARADSRVLVTDVKMPGDLDGFGLAHLVSKRWPEIGIVITSGHVRPGPGDLPPNTIFVPKPYQPSALVAAVQRMANVAAPAHHEPLVAVDPIAVADAVIAPTEAPAGGLLIEPEDAADADRATRARDGEAEAP